MRLLVPESGKSLRGFRKCSFALQFLSLSAGSDSSLTLKHLVRRSEGAGIFI